MSAPRKSRLRDDVIAEVVATLDRAPGYGKYMRGGRQRRVDNLLVYGLAHALRSIYAGRWNFDPRTRAAIDTARDALDELSHAMFDAVRDKKGSAK